MRYTDIKEIIELFSSQVEFLVILDRSGSMSGHPWKQVHLFYSRMNETSGVYIAILQVQSAMLKMIDMTAENPKIFLKIMIYNGEAEFIRVAPLEVKKIR